jgi:malate dehydrogenase
MALRTAFVQTSRVSLSSNAAVFTTLNRNFSRTRALNFKVAVVGAAGGIGQPLSLLLKNSQLVTELSCYDLAPVTPGVAADLSHINTPAKVTGYVGNDQMVNALKDCDIVVVPAGVPRKPGMTRDDLFNINAGIVQGIAKAVAQACPKAMLCIISNPVNSTVPIIAETLKKEGCYDPKRLFGVTTLDVTRSNTFVAANQGFDVNKMNVKVIGGHAGTTILPLLSQVEGAKFSADDIEKLTQRIMFGGDEVVQAKAGGGSATLSMAYAGADFAIKLMRAMKGEKNIVECTYVESTITPARFFASPVTLGPNGAEEVHHFGPISAGEQKILDDMMGDLQSQIAKGVEFATK